MENSTVYVASGAMAALSTLVEHTLQSIVSWLCVMFFVVLADLAAGIYKVMKKPDMKLRISKGMRDTMGKMAAYFAFVVAAAFFEDAARLDGVTRGACIAVIAGESISIFSNLLKAHGYRLDVKALLQLIARKLTMPDELIVEEYEESEKKKL